MAKSDLIVSKIGLDSGSTKIDTWAEVVTSSKQ